MAQYAQQVSVPDDAIALLWRTTTGVPPDPKTALEGGASQAVRAGTVNDPVPIVIENLDTLNPVYLGPEAVDSTNGTKLAAGASITRNVVGNDSEYAIAVGGTVVVAVEIGRS